MPKIISVGESIPRFELSQDLTVEFANELFKDSFKDINRLLQVFENGKIKKRNFVNNLSWFEMNHSFEEKNNSYIDSAVTLGVEAIEKCLKRGEFLDHSIDYTDIDALFFVSSTGISTPSIDARIMNKLPFSQHLKRIPIWGLGCAGGAAGLSRAFEYCRAFPDAKVLVLCIELCSLTFQRNDLSKSNLIGTSLFADGIACACIVGDNVNIQEVTKLKKIPYILDTQSTLMRDSEDVMGWDVKNEGLYVVFSKDIPSIIESWLAPNVSTFLSKHDLYIEDINYFVAHPGGKKVLDAYKNSLGINEDMTRISNEVLSEHGNMSSATVLYVLKKFMLSEDVNKGGYGLAAALGPGFSSELLLLQWG